MWTNEDFGGGGGGGGGGFDISGYSPGAAAAVESKTSKKPSSIFPVTVKQILQSTEETMHVAGLPVSMMSVVGIVKSIEITSTKIVYTVQDWTGAINGIVWIEGDGADDQRQTGVVENTYCRMSGTKRMQDSTPCLFLYSIYPIEDLSELTHFYLQVIHIPLKAEQMKQLGQDKMDVGSYSDMKDSAMSNGGNATAAAGGGGIDNLSFTPQQTRVYRIVQQCISASGIGKMEIFKALEQSMSRVEVEKVMEFLVNEGYVYCTIDDDHFKVTDA